MRKERKKDKRKERSRGRTRERTRRKKSTGFRYRQRGVDDYKRRSEQSGSSRENYIREEIKMFIPKEGLNIIRILPPTWDDADHYGLDAFVHYGVGADNNAYLSRSKMLKEQDPIDEERERAIANDDEDYASSLRPSKRVLVYIIDRDKEDEGPKLWSMAWTLDRDISTLCVDERSGEVLSIDDPEDGYDVEFRRTGKGLKTEYTGVKIGRRSSSLDNEEALEFAIENPIPGTLQYHDYEHIKAVFEGGNAAGDEEEEEEEENENSQYTWKEIHDMDLEDLEEVVDNEELDLDPDDYEEEDVGEFADAICDILDIEKPRRKKKDSGKKGSRTRRKLREMRGKRRR